jgi:ABC-2 type transport system permease protein
VSGLTGTWPLLRLALRVDRVRLPVWVGVITLIVVVTASSFAGLYPDVASRQAFGAQIGTNPALLAVYGPLYAPETIGGLTVWRQGAIQLVLVGLLSLQAVVRHTRAAEETGRLELVASTVVGRRAPLAAGVLAAGVADVAVGIAVAAGMVAVGEPVVGSVAFGAALAATGLAFAGVAAATAQLTDSARAASGLAGGGLAVSFLLRAAGDAATGQSAEWLAWTSPLGWALRIRAYAEERWWVLLLLVGLAVVGTGLGAVLQARRDLGDGIVPPRPGPARAPAGLSSPVGLAWRLQRSTLLWWAVAIAVAGGVFGGVADAVVALFEDNPQLADIVERIGGSSRVVDAFLGAILAAFGVMVAACAVGAVLRLRAEEAADRAEPVLAAPVARLPWAGSHLVLAVVAPGVLLAVAGGTAGLAAGLVTGAGAGEAGRFALAALAQLPAVWVVAGVAVLVVGAQPQRPALAYGALGAFALLALVGEALGLDQVWLDLSPFTHVPALPGAAMDWTPMLWLTVVAVGVGALGLTALRRRDLAP